jgi:hypothetical protein
LICPRTAHGHTTRLTAIRRVAVNLSGVFAPALFILLSLK